MSNVTNLVKASFTISNNLGAGTAVLDMDTTFFVESKRHQFRILLTLMANETDYSYSQPVLSTTIDYCKFLEGRQTNIVFRMLGEVHFKAVNEPYFCPFKKNLHIKTNNQTFSDSFLPPFPVEKLFKFVLRVFGTFKERRGFVFLYGFELFGRFKK